MSEVRASLKHRLNIIRSNIYNNLHYLDHTQGTTNITKGKRYRSDHVTNTCRYHSPQWRSSAQPVQHSCQLPALLQWEGTWAAPAVHQDCVGDPLRPSCPQAWWALSVSVELESKIKNRCSHDYPCTSVSQCCSSHCCNSYCCVIVLPYKEKVSRWPCWCTTMYSTQWAKSIFTVAMKKYRRLLRPSFGTFAYYNADNCLSNLC